MALSSTSIVKVIVVTDDLDKTAAGYKTLLGTGTAPAEDGEHKMVRTPFTKYMGKAAKNSASKRNSIWNDREHPDQREVQGRCDSTKDLLRRFFDQKNKTQ